MRSKQVLFIQHGDTDKPGLLGDVLGGMAIELQVIHPYLGEAVPDSLADYAGLALGGGAQSAYEGDVYPYLNEECGLVRDAVATDRPVIGLCLGAQLMARSLGAEVRKGARKEIGFFEVTLDPISEFDPLWNGLPQTFVTTHWHGDVFDVPPGGMHMGSSALTPNQLFRYGHSLYGLQFHLEMTPTILEEMVVDSRDYLQEAGVDTDAMIQDGYRYLPQLREMATAVFTRWADLL